MNEHDEKQPQLGKAQGDAEIAHKQWTSYFDRFSRQHLDWAVSVEIRSPEGRLIVVEESPLKGVSLESAAGIERAYVQVGDRPETHGTHRIEQPLRVIFKQSPAGEHLGLEIVSANGTTTVIRFRSAMQPEMLDGMAA